MACACKVNQRIDEIQKIYGTNKKKQSKTNIIGNIKIIVKQILIYLLCLPFIPVMFVFLLLNTLLFKKTISIKKILNRKK